MPITTPSDFFLTKPEFDALIVTEGDYLARLYLAADNSPAAVNGLQVIIIDTTGGNVNVTLETPTAAPAKYSPIIVNAGAGVVTITATINGISNPTINTQWAAMAISIYGAQYVSSLKVTV